MKKIFFSICVMTLVISLASCGSSRKLGCPSSAKVAGQVKTVQS